MAKLVKEKRAPGSGSIIARGEGVWLVRWYVGTNAEGKRIYNSQTVHGTHGQAQKLQTQKMGAKDNGTITVTTKLTVCEYLTGLKTPQDVTKALLKAKEDGQESHTGLKGWLGGHVGIGPKTRRDYCQRIVNDVLPHLGMRRLDKLNRLAIQEMVDELMTVRGLSRRTVEYSLVVLKQALGHAVRDGLIGKSPTDFVKLPKKEHTEMQVLDAAQMLHLLDVTTEPQRKALYTVLFTAGLRIQEALALGWADITNDPPALVVRRALVEVTAGQWEIGPPKTKGSTRTIPIPQETLDILQAHRRVQSQSILKSGSKYQRNGLVFAGSEGRHLDISAVRRKWNRDLAAAKLPAINLHGSRHSHFTALLASGEVHLKVAQERAGHSSSKTTMDLYSHVLPSMQRGASDTIGSMLFNPLKKLGSNTV